MSIRIPAFLATVFAVLFFVSAGFAFAKSSDLHVFTSLGHASEASVPGQVVFKYKNDSQHFRTLSVPNVSAAIEALQHNPNVEYAEPNYIASAYATPNDPYFSPFQWNFDNPVNGGVHAKAAWDVTNGAGATVAVIDSGVAYENYSTGSRRSKTSYYLAPDLAGTCFVPGYDFVNGDAHPNDDNAHGTHVTGTIAQTTNNALGTAGLAHGACIMPLKALDAQGYGSYTDIANAIYFAANNGADVINMSLGGSVGANVLEDALAYAYAHGVTIVAATGNDNGAVGYPAAYDSYVIAVGATRYDEARAPYSNFGPSVDVVAPGGDTSVDQNGDGYVDGILQQTINPQTHNTGDFGYWFFQGTSMATPHVAAAAAMVIAHGNATAPDDVREALQSTATDLGTPGRDDFFGYGLIDIPAALAWSAGPQPNAAPVANAGPDQEVVDTDENGTETVTLDGSDSSDDVAVVSYEWYENAALIATGVSPVLDFSIGDHPLTLVVKDAEGLQGSDNVLISVVAPLPPPPPVVISLSTLGYKVKGWEYVDLSWSGATTAQVDVFRNGTKIITTDNDGAYTHTLNARGGGTYTYKVCETGGGACSNDSVVVF